LLPHPLYFSSDFEVRLSVFSSYYVAVVEAVILVFGGNLFRLLRPAILLYMIKYMIPLHVVFPFRPMTNVFPLSVFPFGGRQFNLSAPVLA